MMTTGGRILLCVLTVILCVARACRAGVVINELYYDHPGTDTGHEFIELINAGVAPVDLAGATVEFHNGAGTTWALVWRAPPGTVLAPDGIFVVGGELVAPVPDAVIAYALQNGPDSIRLVAADGGVLDVLGYGGLDDGAFVESLGVAPVAAGKSVARALDGVDSNDNSIDFVAAVPTPGRHNVAREDVALVLDAATPARAGRDHAGNERMRVVIENRGLVTVPAGSVQLEVVDSSATGVVEQVVDGNRSDIGAGRSESVAFTIPLDAGYHWLELVARFERDERDENNAVHALRRIGRIPLLVSEVWSAPRDGCPQFVEWMNAGHEPLDLTGFTLRDERARPVAVDADTLVIAPGGWIALAADPDRLRACVPGAPRDRLLGVRGAWPTFNRSGGAVADSVVVLDRHGIVVDAVSYPAIPSKAAGRSLERIDLFPHGGPAVWRLSDAAAGCSPAMPNGAFVDHPAPSGSVLVSPNPFAPSRGDVLRIATTPVAGISRADVSVFDLEGHRMAALGGTSSFPSLVVWDGRCDDGTLARPGLYLVAVELYSGGGVRVGVEKVVVGCAGNAVP